MPSKIICLSILIFFLVISCKDQDKRLNIESKDVVSLEEMIGQMIMIGFRGFTIEEVSPKIKKQIESGRTGGIILFDYDVVKKEAVRNIKSPEQVKQLVSDLQELAPEPIFVGIDQEGGKVNRLKTRYGFPASVSNKYLGNLDNIDSTQFYARRNAILLKDLGINVNFSPAVDMEVNPENPVIGKVERSYGVDAKLVTKHANIWIAEQRKQGIISTLKHFPGHGSSRSDSHYGVTDITKYWSEKELEPFKSLVKEDQKLAVMTAHVVNQNLDDEYPATLSRKIIDGILREKLAFNGVVFSDDLQMKAVNKQFGFETIVLKAIEAGVDVLVTGNNLEYDEDFADKAFEMILKLVEEGKISEERIQLSYSRIQKLKAGI